MFALSLSGMASAGAALSPSKGGASYNPAAVALFARMAEQPPAYWKAAINRLIVDGTADGWFQKMVWFSCLALQTEQQAYLDWTSSRSLTASGVYTHTPNEGWTGSGANTTGGRLGTGVNASALLSQNSMSVGGYVRTNGTSGSDPIVGLIDVTTDRLRLAFRTSADQFSARLADATTMSGASTQTRALVTGTRTAANVKKVYIGATEVGSASTASAAIPAVEIVFSASGPTNRSNAELAVVFAGLGLDATDVANMNTRISALVAETQPREVLVIGGGQSNMARMFMIDAGSGSGDGTAGSDAISRVFVPALQTSLDAVWTGRKNTISILAGAVGGSSVLNVQADENYWWNRVLGQPAIRLTTWKAQVSAIAASVRLCDTIVIVWAQGEAEASNLEAAAPSLDWETDTKLVFAEMRAHLASCGFAGTVQIVVQPLGPHSGVGQTKLNGMRAIQNEWPAEVSDLTVTVPTTSIPRVAADDWHAVNGPTGYDQMARDLHDAVFAAIT